MNGSKKGFTIIELIIVLVIAGIIGSVAIPKLFNSGVIDANGTKTELGYGNDSRTTYTLTVYDKAYNIKYDKEYLADRVSIGDNKLTFFVNGEIVQVINIPEARWEILEKVY